MKAYYILSAMIIVLIVLFAILPKFLKMQNERMRIERRYHLELKRAIDQNLDLHAIKAELVDILPQYFKNLKSEEQNSKLELDLKLLRKQK